MSDVYKAKALLEISGVADTNPSPSNPGWQSYHLILVPGRNPGKYKVSIELDARPNAQLPDGPAFAPILVGAMPEMDGTNWWSDPLASGGFYVSPVCPSRPFTDSFQKRIWKGSGNVTLGTITRLIVDAYVPNIESVLGYWYVDVSVTAEKISD